MSRGPDPQTEDVLAQQISGAPFRPGQRVCVPGRYKRMIVQCVWRGRDVITERVDGMTVKTVFPGDWYVRAEFESGHGWYEGKAHEFSHE